ncbi:MAG TPA: hypothetical protein VFZ66_26700 [Herpetosiphonaceae bacterium]
MSRPATNGTTPERNGTQRQLQEPEQPTTFQGLPTVQQNQYAISVLTADSSANALSTIQKQIVSAIHVHGLASLPTLHNIVDTLFIVTAHSPTALESGDLLVTDQSSNRIMLVREGQSRPYLDVSSWCNAHLWDTATNSDRSRLYVSMSGMRGPTANHIGVAGTAAVLEIDTTTGNLLRAFTAYDAVSGLPYQDRMLDLAGLVVTPDDKRVLVCDFNNWQGNGKVIAIDLGSGDISILTDGLDQPSTLSVDGPDHVLVANTRQPHGKASGGQIIRVNIHTGEKEEIAEITGVDASLIGVVRLPDGSFAGTMSEGTQEKCVVVHVDSQGNHRTIWHPQPGFLGSGISSDGSSLWVAETLRSRVYQLNFDGSIKQHFQVYDGIDQNNLEFMFRGFDTLESVKVVA